MVLEQTQEVVWSPLFFCTVYCVTDLIVNANFPPQSTFNNSLTVERYRSGQDYKTISRALRAQWPQ